MNLNQVFRRDSELLAWSATFSGKINGGNPATFGLTAELATDYQAKQAAFAEAMAAVQDVDTRTRTDVVTKRECRKALVAASRQLVNVCEAWPQMTDTKRSQLNLPIRDRDPTPTPRPTSAPILDVVSQVGLTVTIALRDASDSTRRRRPDGVMGATILSHVGETAPATIDGWTFQGNTSKTTVDITFPPMTPRGARVWVTAVWYNRRSQSGAPSRPLSTYVAGADGLSMAA